MIYSVIGGKQGGNLGFREINFNNKGGLWDFYDVDARTSRLGVPLFFSPLNCFSCRPFCEVTCEFTTRPQPKWNKLMTGTKYGICNNLDSFSGS
jgi:hypothetical protein